MALWVIPLPAAAGDPDNDLLKANLKNFWTGALSNQNDPQVRKGLQEMERAAQIDLAVLGADGSWPDIDYADVPVVRWSVMTHFDRMNEMALAFRSPGQAYYNDPQMLNGALKALAYIQQRINPSMTLYGNWWWWEFRVPSSLGILLLLLEGDMPQATADYAKATMDFLMPSDRPEGTGQNLIWSAETHLYMGLLNDDTPRLLAVADAFSLEAAVQDGEGIKEDYSFHQHGSQLYSATYGAYMADYLAEYILIANGTRYVLQETNLSSFTRFISDGQMWMLYRNIYDPSSMSREMTRGNRPPIAVPNAFAVSANLEHSAKDKIVQADKYMIAIEDEQDIGLEPMWTYIKSSPLPPDLFNGHKHFHMSDYTVHRRDTFFSSVKMFSNRVENGEYMNGEGRKSWHLSDGVTWVVINGDEYVDRDILPAMDWQRLPGTTVERKTRTAGSGMGPGTASFVGGAYTDFYGVSAMDLNANASVLSAKKSWFFFEKEIVCLGSDIDCPSASTAETTIAQWPLKSSGSPIWVDGLEKPRTIPWNEMLTAPRWVQCDNMGYFIPTPLAGSPTSAPMVIQAARAAQSGSWSGLNSAMPATVYTKSFLQLVVNHGANAADASYRFAILPNQTPATMAEYAAADPVSILAQDNAVHAVRQAQLRANGFVFWQAGEAPMDPEGAVPEGPRTIKTDRPCIIFTQENDTDMAIAVSEPTHSTSVIELVVHSRQGERLQLVYSPPGVDTQVAYAYGTTTIRIPVTNGRNYLLYFKRLFLDAFAGSGEQWMMYN